MCCLRLHAAHEPKSRTHSSYRSGACRSASLGQSASPAAAGVESQQSAQQVGTSRPTVQLWRERFLALCTAGLEEDAPRPGLIPPFSNAQRAAIVKATLHRQPPHATHWSTRPLTADQDQLPSRSSSSETIGRITTLCRSAIPACTLASALIYPSIASARRFPISARFTCRSANSKLSGWSGSTPPHN